MTAIPAAVAVADLRKVLLDVKFSFKIMIMVVYAALNLWV
jgi:hypothetical protein